MNVSDIAPRKAMKSGRSVPATVREEDEDLGGEAINSDTDVPETGDDRKAMKPVPEVVSGAAASSEPNEDVEGARQEGGGGEKERQLQSVEKDKARCFGVKSYLHHFYYAGGDVTSDVYENVVEDDDDFEYLVEPGKRRARWCCWFRWCIWSGANLLLIGIITLLVGHLTPKREEVVDYHDHLEVFDRWAITYNQRLEFCRLAGLVIFFIGGFVIFLTLLASTCVKSESHGDGCCCYERRDAPTTTTLLASYRGDVPVVDKIPVVEEIKSVQPPFEAPGKRVAGVEIQMPYY